MNDSTDSLQLNIYDEVLDDTTAYDCSSQRIEIVPHIDNKLLCALYLQNNKIKSLPDDLFPSLPGLMYLDLRENLLTEIPKTIKNHPCLTHLLLQNNKITALPIELGSVATLKVLQLNGNPLTFPPKNIINAGVSKLLDFLHDKYLQNVLLEGSQSEYSEDNCSNTDNFKDNTNTEARSYNSVLDEDKIKKMNDLRIKFNEKDSDGSDEEHYPKGKGKCPKLAKSRYKILSPHSQTAKYLKPLLVGNSSAELEKIKRNYLKDLAIKKQKDLLAKREKIIQERKNLTLLMKWRKNYRTHQCFADDTYRLDPKHYPYDTSPEYMTLLTREDIEKDLPDKLVKRLYRRCKPTVPRKANNDVHLALKIKQLFDNLEAIDLNKQGLTPRTEQKVLLNEIQKITEIKQKLTELSQTNSRSIAAD